LKRYCKKNGVQFYLSNNVKLAIKLDLDGAYIPSFNRSTKHLAYSLKKKFSIIGSAHNLKEIKIKENQNVTKIFLSSLFKKNKNYLGINKFKLVANLTQKKVVALGGISKKNINKLKLLKKYEFAGISYFE
jgi:thiamine-phosphate pyrophosphorylase